MKQPTLFDDTDATPPDATPPDQVARDFAVDPANDVVLEASAGTGKTRVLVERYVRLVLAGIEPRNILAITFTRKAAAEMRGRVLAELRDRARTGAMSRDQWRALSERVGDIQIATIDAFCFGLLREFPLEANVDPAFDVADETEMARFANEAVDVTLRVARTLVVDDEHVRLLFARVKTTVLGQAMSSLLDRRHVALPAVATFVRRGTAVGSATDVGIRFVRRLADVIEGSSQLGALVEDGPMRAPGFRWLAADLRRLGTFPSDDPAAVQQLRRRLERHFLTKDGAPRQRISKPIVNEHFASPEAKKRHERAIAATSPGVLAAIEQLDVDLNVVLARGLLRVLRIAVDRYERLLDDHALIDFAGMLTRSVALLERQEEFARSRLKLQARYHHVLVDEFQDTSRLQWRLVELLIDAWGEGEGTTDAPTSIFIVGDRKQSIYRFRHAEVTLLDDAARRIGGLRFGRIVRQAITTSFRAVPELLAFVNALAGEMEGDPTLDDRFSYRDTDRFPVPAVEDGARRDGRPVLGLIAEPSMAASAAAVADEVASLVGQAVVRDRAGGTRLARPDDVAILFRARAGHQYFEDALEDRGVRTYVYKGLGFFDAPEVQDLEALLRYLATPDSDLRAAELLRSRLVRLSDVGLARIGPAFAASLGPHGARIADPRLGNIDRLVIARARESVARWLPLADRIPPSELLDAVLRDSAYAFELRGRRLDQARENIKKVRALIRRVENRGYATLGRIATYFETLSAGDEANAIVEASGAVNLMTIHAAKGLEFPIIFLVNLHVPGRGRPGGFSVIERGPDGAPDVAFNQTDATRLEEKREQEELRRLLYVGVTRARDRLYLSAEVDDKPRMRRGGRSLASLLPAGLAQSFATAASSPDVDEVTWSSASGGFAFKVCRALPRATIEAPVEAPILGGPLEVTPIRAVGASLSAVTAGTVATPEGTTRAVMTAPSGDERLVGRLVHRLFQRSVDATLPEYDLLALAMRLLTPEERVDAADIGRTVGEASRLYRAFRQRGDVARLLAAGQCFYEVPFSFEPADRPGQRIRGSVDCLVRSPDGSTTVLEFKTGEPRQEHEAQAALYAEAVQAALSPSQVIPRVLYA